MQQFTGALRGLFITPARAATLTVTSVAIISGFALNQRSVEVLSKVGPKIRIVAECAATKPIWGDNGEKITFKVYHGQRTDAEQRDMIAKGVSWVNRSRHQDGAAVDLLAVVNGRDTWSHAPYYKIAEAFYACGKEKSIPITWGCTWKVKDCVHFEVKQ